ncbi:Velvet complex subunit 2 [Claviceps digitariae]|nr:Velvet complex subunit 2 [Claviceps digitariae]
MSQQLPLPGASYPPPPPPPPAAAAAAQGSRASSSHQAFGHPVYGYQSHQQAQQQPRHHLQQQQQRHPSQHHELHSSSHISNPPPPSTHSHSLPQHVHHLPSSQMPPPPCDAQQNPPGPPIVSMVPSMSFKPAGIPRVMAPPFSKVEELSGRRYRLDVVQQPKRARMCGFGDKDRRPITPPPCVRLIITNAVTGLEIDCNDVDHSMFVLNVDLWNEDGTREVNLVRSSATSPSISATVPYTYPAIGSGEAGMVPYAHNRDSAFNQPQAVAYGQDYQMQSSYGQAPAYPPNNSYGPPQQFFPHHQSYRSDAVPSQSSVSPYQRNNSTGGAPAYIPEHGCMTRMAIVSGQPQGMFTRNLIGSLAASAFRLSDTEEHIGIWFVLQDLSVRTEGPFRLRFSFVNVGKPDGAPRDAGGSRVNKSRAPILACCFSEVFNVYSAKKFPGVCESTPLSKTFATQGIKIPIRKDTNVKGGEDDDYGD